MTAQELAQLAVARARLQRGMSTAQACGDFEWVADNRLAMMELNNKMDEAVSQLPQAVINEAREITNAPI